MGSKAEVVLKEPFLVAENIPLDMLSCPKFLVPRAVSIQTTYISFGGFKRSGEVKFSTLRSILKFPLASPFTLALTSAPGATFETGKFTFVAQDETTSRRIAASESNNLLYIKFSLKFNANLRFI